ncbi:hypothetical protein [Methanothrix sp.]|uniref:hypothetical protein n=1 Tax=Methanothrix sp. TaxID=90426 RepID=UPI003C783AA5
MSENLAAALLLTLLAGSATGIGSLISYIVPRPDMRYLSLSLGFASGVMIYVAFVDLFCSSREIKQAWHTPTSSSLQVFF